MRWPSLVQRFGTLVLTPLRFSLRTGHARSSLVRRAVAPSGAPLPWLTYPAIDLLANVDVAGRSVLEFGAGQSTLWWLSRGAEVISFDDDAKWIKRVRQKAPQADIRQVDSALSQFPAELLAARFDVVVIDGLRRQVAARIARDLVAASGCIIQDNSENFWSDMPGKYEIIELLANFQRIDLYGFAPGVWRRHCTSIYFRESCFLFQNARPPARLDYQVDHT
jgi:hypothetical protein